MVTVKKVLGMSLESYGYHDIEYVISSLQQILNKSVISLPTLFE